MHHLLAAIYHPISTWLNGRGASIIVHFATWLWAPFLPWIIFLFFDSRRQPHAPSMLRSCALFLHLCPAALMHLVATKAPTYHDPVLTWFALLLTLRYSRTIVNIYFWSRYEPTTQTNSTDPPPLTPTDCTVIIPTVGPQDNTFFRTMLASILANHPAHIVLSANNARSAWHIRTLLPALLAAVQTGTSAYQTTHYLDPPQPPIRTLLTVRHEPRSNKRHQLVGALPHANTRITVLADDSAVWAPGFLAAALPAFAASPSVGLVATRKWVLRRRECPYDARKSRLANAWAAYCEGLWNTLGAVYLVRHNFEMRASSAADGGIFCVSGRTSLVRSEILADAAFQRAFLDEYVGRLGGEGWLKGVGPLGVDDDNFITRWVVRHGWDVGVQCTEEATVTVPLGERRRFLQQCARWSRTTMRQNPGALFVDRVVWWKWPVTVWATYFAWMVNFAVVWDSLILYVFVHTRLYAEAGERKGGLLAGLVAWLYASKLVKTWPWFWAHPADFWMYFFPVPACVLFGYFHSLIKLWSVLTFWDLSWSGRKFPEDEAMEAGKVEGGEKQA